MLRVEDYNKTNQNNIVKNFLEIWRPYKFGALGYRPVSPFTKWDLDIIILLKNIKY